MSKTLLQIAAESERHAAEGGVSNVSGGVTNLEVGKRLLNIARFAGLDVSMQSEV